MKLSDTSIRIFTVLSVCLLLAGGALAANQNDKGTDGNSGSGVSGSTGNQGNDKLVGNAGGSGSSAPSPSPSLPSATPEPMLVTLAGMTAAGLAGFFIGRRFGK